MKINTKKCEFCRYNMRVSFDNMSDIKSGIKYWCRDLNIPLFTPEKTICDNYRFLKRFRSGNGYNFKKIECEENTNE